VVRNSWLTKPDREEAGFWDAAEWEKVKRREKSAIKRWIREQMKGASVTVVLIGAETSTREWVHFEIKESYRRHMGMLGIYIHRLKDRNGHTDRQGTNPFDLLCIEQNGQKKFLSQIYHTYDWVLDDGYHNFGKWVEIAARDAGR